MPNQTQTAGMPLIAGGDEVYDQIMGAIEPDLTTAQFPLVDQKYANETPEENTARMVRYKNAFEKYAAEYEKYKAQKQNEIAALGRNLKSASEGKFRKQDEESMASIESQITNI